MIQSPVLLLVFFITHFIRPIFNDRICLCDIRPSVCDKFCQCDTDCFSGENNSFSSYISLERGSYGSRWCIPKGLHFLSNAAFSRSQDGENICFSDTNYLRENYLQLSRGSGQFWMNSISITNLNLINDCSEDYLCLFYRNRILGRFTLPSGLGCRVDFSPKFLNNITTKCTRTLNFKDNGSSCTQLPSVLTYTDGLKFLRLPISKLFQNKSIRLEEIMASNNTVSIGLFICKNLNDDVISCPTSPSLLDSTKQACMNAVMGVKFSIIYNENGITNISVEFIIANVTTTKFDQFHTAQFIEENNLSNISTLIATDYLSGNPGYLKSYPIRAGYKEDSNATNSYITMIPYPLNPIIYPNEYGRMNFGWWPIPNIGDCTKYTSQSKTILFGQNTFSSCVLRLKPLRENNYTNCNELEQVISMSLKPPITHVGIWGNADNKRITDWIKVDIFNEKQNNTVFSNGTKSWSCQNIIIGQTINIYYARKGSLYDPQNRIIAVHKVYKRGTIGYKCQGYACIDDSQSNPEQKFLITTNVLFHDLTLL
ncbi:unnamed protein product [Schistosoma rodhaini]|uniref:Tectonic-1-3 domain-containing protein n=1 Tax=Schistosoma rodhaini TaxID=6188 RepID=A0AA85EST4_9TREM|nr:unnamed protein product [Schistosoma rodhaini]